MSKRIFTQEQIKQLSKNKYVAKCSKKSITYTKDFKIKTVKMYQENGFSPQEIFIQLGFDLNVIGRQQPRQCVIRWKNSFRTKGIGGLEELRGKSKNGGRPKTKNITDKDKIERLEAEVAYLKAENDFLAKLRAKRAE